MTDKLTTFLYLLIRDDMAAGRVIQLANEARDVRKPIFTNPHLEALARDVAERLQEPPSGP